MTAPNIGVPRIAATYYDLALQHGLDMSFSRTYYALDPRYKMNADGVADDADGMQRLADHVNSDTSEAPALVVIPPMRYKYSVGPWFQRQCVIHQHGSQHNYTGEGGNVLELGPRGMETAANEPLHRIYEVYGGNYTGGLDMENGIKVNSFLTSARVRFARFSNFGGPTSCAIFAQASNWLFEVLGCTWMTDSLRAGDPTTKRNFLSLWGRYASGGKDNGQSRLQAFYNLIGEQTLGGGTAYYINGRQSLVQGGSSAGFGRNFQIGPDGMGTTIDHVYQEVITGTESIRIGDDDDALDAGNGITVSNCSSNMHSSDTYATTANFIGPANTGLVLCNMSVFNNTLIDLDPARPLVRQNNVLFQTNNLAFNNRNYATTDGPQGLTLHTTGGSIDAWSTYSTAAA